MTSSCVGVARRSRAAGVPPLKCPRPVNKLFVFVFFALLALLLSLPAPAQVPAPQPQQQQKMSESVSVGYVMIPFTALDPKGRAITDLRSSEVSLQVDDQP